MNHTRDVALSVSNVKKSFYLPHHTNGSAKEAITQLFKPKDKGGDYYHALMGVSFEVKKGDFFGVVGRNGAGKSTLLKIMAQIYQPTSGQVKVSGKLVPFIELGVGFNNNLTGRQNVYLNGAMLGFSKKEMDARYDSIVEFAELEKFMDQKLKNYSSGMRVRLAFSVAIQADADILLLDEVLAVGDASFKKKCYAYFDTLKEMKKTIIFVSHGMGAIREYCNKAILIEDGKIAYQGSADEVADRYMQLFEDKSKEKSVADSGQAGERSGSKKVTIDHFNFTKNDEKMKIDTTISCGEHEINNVQLKIEIKNRNKQVVAAFSNLSVDKIVHLNFESNETKRLLFDMKNIYRGGRYHVSAILCEANDADEDGEIYDQWDNIAEFSSTGDVVRYQVVNPGKLSLEPLETNETQKTTRE